MEQRKAFVTGATGCIGYNLVLELIKRGWNTTVLHRRTSDVSDLKSLDIRLLETDLLDFYRLSYDIPMGVDAIFHVAGNTNFLPNNNKQQWIDNVVSTRNIAKVAIEKNTKRFIYTSTAACSSSLTFEEDLMKNQSNYIFSKRAADKEIYESIPRGLNATILRPTVVLGINDKNNYINLFKLAKNNKLKYVLPGDMSFCNAKDVAIAHIEAVDYGVLGYDYYLTGQKESWLNFFNILIKKIGNNTRSINNASSSKRLNFIARLNMFLYRWFKKTPKITPSLIGLLTNTRDVPIMEVLKTKEDLRYQITPLDQTIDEYIEWLTIKKLI